MDNHPLLPLTLWRLLYSIAVVGTVIAVIRGSVGAGVILFILLKMTVPSV